MYFDIFNLLRNSVFMLSMAAFLRRPTTTKLLVKDIRLMSVIL